MTRTYLHVPPEEYAQAQTSGAVWDAERKCWYVPDDPIPAALSRWIDDEDGEDGEPFNLELETVMVAVAQAPCLHCRTSIPMLALYGQGVDLGTGEHVAAVTVSSVWAVDEALARQLARWPYYRRENLKESDEVGPFANHCRQCGAVQEEQQLHDEPGDVFFGLSPARSGVEFTQLKGPVRLGGDYAFEVGDGEG